MTAVEASAILGVRLGASPAEVRAAYRTRSQLLHPDKHATASDRVVDEAKAAMQQLNAALDVLLAEPQPHSTGTARAGTANAAAQSLTCTQCGWAQRVEAGAATHSCLRCQARLRRTVCSACDTSVALWSDGPWACPRCGSHQHFGVPHGKTRSPAGCGFALLAALVILVLLLLL
jgi:predicted RNA-binding Zn-ribbon protein involved in translation (DUF1610 family)